MSSLGEDWFYIDEVVALSVVSGTDEAVSRGRLSTLWTGGCYDCGCSRVGVWIFPNMVIGRFFDICHYASEADINRGGVKIPSQFGFLY